MKKTSLLKYCGIMCVGSALLSSPSFAMVPTMDAASVTSAINQAATTSSGYLEIVNSTASITTLNQSIGDNVGSMSQFQDNAEKAEKEKEKAEKARKRAERLKKLKKAYSDAKEVAADAKKAYEDGKAAYENAKEVYDSAKETYASAKEIYTSAKETYSDYKETAQGLAAKDNGDNYALYDETSEQPDVSDNQEVFTIDEEGLENETFSDEELELDEEDEFSQDAWDIQEALETETEEVSELQPAVSPTLSTRSKFTNLQDTAPVTDQPQAGAITGTTSEVAAPVAKPAVGAPVAMPVGKIVAGTQVGAITGATPVVQKLNAQSSSSLSKVKPAAQKLNVKPSLSTQEVTPAATVSTPLTTTTSTRRKFGGNKNKLLNVDKNKINSISDKSLKKLKTSSMEENFRYETISAFAQQAETSVSEFKTGTTDSGNFIFSDVIATKCGLDMSGDIEKAKENLTSEKIDECLKKWIVGLNAKNQEEKEAWIEDHLKALHNHVSADLAKALENKSYSATFDETIVSDLDNKSQATTTERDEVSFSGEVARTNQKIVLKLMQSLAAKTLTDAWGDIPSISPSDLDLLEEDGDSK